MSIITLTTDFGLRDHFVGALKGKILTEYPDCRIVDISHQVDPFNIHEASYLIASAWSAFPKGTVHLVGVDAEWHPDRRHIAMQWNGHFFIGADNGILSILISKILPEKIVEINIHDRFPKGTPDLDVLVRVACHLAKGGLLNVVGKDTGALLEITELKAIASADRRSMKGYVIYIDHFGNAVVNISRKMFQELSMGRDFTIEVGKHRVRNIHDRYSDIVPPGKSAKPLEGNLVAVFNESGFLEIGIYRSNPKLVGSAETLLGLKFQSEVRIIFVNPK